MATKTATKKAPDRNREVIPGLESVLTPAFAPGWTFDVIGKTRHGIITAATTVHASEYNDPSTKKYWPSGEPMMILVITVADTDSGEDASLWVRGKSMNDALRLALRRAEVQGIAEGDRIAVTWTGEEEVFDKRGKPLSDARKLYDIDIDPS
jgi:hypothetical protein